MKLDAATLARRIDIALGREPADLVVKGGRILDVVTGEVAEGDIAVAGDTIVGTYEGYEGRRVVDARGKVVVPGFVDAHVHVESTMVTPAEFDACVLPRGTTTAVCDPHEVANVLGLGACGTSSTPRAASRWTCSCSSRRACPRRTSRRAARGSPPTTSCPCAATRGCSGSRSS
jgi:adenine deaminase